MILKKASKEAIQYSCKNFHYSKSVPVNPFAFSVYNDKNEWCGCIIYGRGTNFSIGKSYGLAQGQVVELVRMALNGKQEKTSKALSLSLKLLKNYLPLVKLVVSYADTAENHIGTIYQSTNWYYEGRCKSTKSYWYNNKWTHQKLMGSIFKSITKIPKSIKTKPASDKLKYIYPIDKSLVELCKQKSKPYPKLISGDSINVVHSTSSREMEVIPTSPLK